MEQAQTRTKAQEPKPDQVSLHTLPRGVCNTLKMVRAPQIGICLLPSGVRKVEIDPQNRSFPIPVLTRVSELRPTNPHTRFFYINTLISPFQRTESIYKNHIRNYRQITQEIMVKKSFLKASLFS